jgi:type IV secretory pathway TraG/TraD family ATPase VirD4
MPANRAFSEKTMDIYKPDFKSHEGFETWLNTFKLKLKMHTRIALVLVLVLLVLFAASVMHGFSHETDVAIRWSVAKATYKFIPGFKLSFRKADGSKILTTASSLAATPWVEKIASKELSRLGWNFSKLFLALSLLYPIIVMLFKRRSIEQSDKRYIRGARIDPGWAFRRLAKKRKEATDLPFGSVNMPVAAEPKHCFIVGRPGTGKTVCMSAILHRLKDRDARAIVYDTKGDYLSKFYDPGHDLIFNPLDTRSLGWNVFNEVETIMDVDAIASSLIPSGIAHNDPFWIDAARSVFSGILHNLHTDNSRSNRDIWEMITSEGKHISTELKLTRGGEAGHRFIENPESNQALGVFAVLMQHTKAFEYMAGCDGDFSVKDWLQSGQGMIYITNYADVKDTLKPILSLFIDLMGRKLLSLPDSHQRRIFFLIDEFGTLQRLPTILDLLTLSRSKGGSVFIGIQDYGKIDKLYSREIRQSLVNACGSSVTYSVSDESAKIASNTIGETEFMDSERSFTMGVKNFRDGTNLAQRKRKEALFLASDISNLPDLTGIVKFPNYNYVVSKWLYTAYPTKNPPMVVRDDLLIENIKKEEEKIRQQLEEQELEIVFED